ncbi:MAG: hypothetical protein ACI91O_000348 [Candidatus Poriferisodalaceae bacterium]|jgi:hypothetical protein
MHDAAKTDCSNTRFDEALSDGDPFNRLIRRPTRDEVVNTTTPPKDLADMNSVFTLDTNSAFADSSRVFTNASRCASASWLSNEQMTAYATFTGRTEMVNVTTIGIKHPAGRPREVVM